MIVPEKNDVIQILNFNFNTGTISENISEETFIETLKYNTIYAFRIEFLSKKWIELFFYKAGEMVTCRFFTSHQLSDGSYGGNTGICGNLYTAVMRFVYNQEIHTMWWEE